MNLYKQFVKETGLKANYVKWLENKFNDKEDAKQVNASNNKTLSNLDDSDSAFIDSNGIIIDYDDPTLGYEVAVKFSRFLIFNEREQIEDIIHYWSSIPYVSTEGHYGIRWILTENNTHELICNIDFTKSASDDIGAYNVLEKLGEWIWHGTPIRKKNGRKFEGVAIPYSIKAGSM